MSATSTCNTVNLVGSVSSLLPLLHKLAKLATAPSPLFIAVEGASPFQADGSLRVLSLYITPQNEAHLIDVESLGEAAFSTKNDNGFSLKLILESPTIRKVAFDVRHLSRALFRPFQISLDGIEDLQLLEMGTRVAWREAVASLWECVDQESTVSAAAKEEWRVIEKDGSYLFNSDKRGDQMFDGWQTTRTIIQYCKQHVAVLPILYRAYTKYEYEFIQQIWQDDIREITKKRIKESQCPAVKGSPESSAHGGNDSTVCQAKTARSNSTEMHATEATPVPDENVQRFVVPAGYLDYEADDDGEGEEDDEDNWYNETAQEWTSWEEDMVMNGEKFI